MAALRQPFCKNPIKIAKSAQIGQIQIGYDGSVILVKKRFFS